MKNQSTKGIALILFGILLSIAESALNDIVTRSFSAFPFSLVGLLIGIVGLVFVFRQEKNK